MDKKLTKLPGFTGIEGPVLTVVMDGIGVAPANAANAVNAAYTPTLDITPMATKASLVISGSPFSSSFRVVST